MGGAKLAKSGLQKVYEYMANLTKKLTQGTELSSVERQDYLNYLQATKNNPQFRDAPPGFSVNPLNIDPRTAALYRGAALEDPAERLPLFTFMGQPSPATSYVYSSPGSITKFIAPEAKPGRLNDMLSALLEDPRTFRKAVPEVEYGIDSEIGDMSGIHDFLYSQTVRDKLAKQGFNSMVSWEDSFYNPSLVPGFVALQHGVLKPIVQHQVAHKGALNQLLDEGYSAKKFTNDYYKVGRAQKPGEFFRKKARGGLV